MTLSRAIFHDILDFSARVLATQGVERHKALTIRQFSDRIWLMYLDTGKLGDPLRTRTLIAARLAAILSG